MRKVVSLIFKSIESPENIYILRILSSISSFKKIFEFYIIVSLYPCTFTSLAFARAVVFHGNE